MQSRQFGIERRFRSEDLPTFDRPANATSGSVASGRKLSAGADLRNATGPAKVLRALSISSEWFGKNGKRHRAAFGGRADGVPYPFHDTPHADALSFESVSPTLLHSTTWHDGREVQWSERELVDGDTLVIRMRGHLSDGRSYTNVGVFRRQAD